jgi:hypothetical protein
VGWHRRPNPDPFGNHDFKRPVKIWWFLTFKLISAGRWSSV